MEILFKERTVGRYEKEKALVHHSSFGGLSCVIYSIVSEHLFQNQKERAEDRNSGEQSHTTWMLDKHLELGPELHTTNCRPKKGFGTEDSEKKEKSCNLSFVKILCMDNSLLWKIVSHTHTTYKNNAEKGEKSIILKMKRKSNFCK